MLFHIIDGAQGVTHSRGLYRQVKLYHRGGYLYARHGAGFVRVYTHGGTSVIGVSLAPENIDMGESEFSIEKHMDKWRVIRSAAMAAE